MKQTLLLLILCSSIGRSLPWSAVCCAITLFPQKFFPRRPVQFSFPSVQQPHQARFAIKAFEGEFFADAIAAVDLNCGIGRLKCHFGRALFCERSLFEISELPICARG